MKLPAFDYAAPSTLAEALALLASHNGDALTYSVTSNSNPNLVEAVITGGKLTLTYTPSQNGRARIVLRATDAEGRFTETTFVVSVGAVTNDTNPPVITIHDPTPGQTVTSP